MVAGRAEHCFDRGQGFRYHSQTGNSMKRWIDRYVPSGPRRSPGVLIALAAALSLVLLARLAAPDAMGGSVGSTVLAGSVAERVLLAFRTATPTSTPTPMPTATRTATATPMATPTWTPMPSPTATQPPGTLVPTGTLVPADTPAPTATATPTMIATPAATPRPQPTPDGVARTLEVPILMYHYVSTPPDDADAVRRDLSVPPERFEEHLAYLREAGYASVSLRDLVLALTIGFPLPERPIVLTFDDGYRDAYEHAYPLLLQYGFTGTFFLITSAIDQQNPNYLTWQQVAEMSAGGMAMEAHGYTHDAMEGRERDYLIWQMLGSKEAIEARTNETVRFFCYPSGYYDEEAMQVLHELGYWAATTIEFGQEHSSESLFDLHRVRIHGEYTVDRLAALLEALREP